MVNTLKDKDLITKHQYSNCCKIFNTKVYKQVFDYKTVQTEVYSDYDTTELELHTKSFVK